MRLLPMGDSEYRRFLEWAIADYAEGKVRAGQWKVERAHELAEEALSSLLPDGLSTADQYLYTILDESAGGGVGYLWFGVRGGEDGRYAALYEFVIHEGYRRRGYGTGALRALEAEVRRLGLEKIVLHVFGHNEAARALYRKVGYVETNVTMAKKV